MSKHTVIVPGVGGSDAQHWQSWLQAQLANSSRVEQSQWDNPVLSQWVQHFVAHVQEIDAPLQIIAHSFGCLTVVAAIDQYPALKNKIESILLVAPANPKRFAKSGFAKDQAEDYAGYFASISLGINSLIVFSENDPWHEVESTLSYAKAWGCATFNQGASGHINVASGFGAWPQVFNHLERLTQRSATTTDQAKLLQGSVLSDNATATRQQDTRLL